MRELERAAIIRLLEIHGGSDTPPLPNGVRAEVQTKYVDELILMAWSALRPALQQLVVNDDTGRPDPGGLY